MKTKNKTIYKINSDSHLRNIYDGNRYLELGIIDVETMNKLLAYEVINIKEITYFKIQNKGLGRSEHPDQYIQNNLPYLFFRMLSEGNPEIKLVITYGMYYYRDRLRKKDEFAPVIFIPIRMYYENDNTFVQMISKPFENIELFEIVQDVSKAALTPSEPLTNLYALDSYLTHLEKHKPGSIRIENYLSFVVKRREQISINKKFFDNKYSQDFTLKKGNYYYSRMLTRNQKLLVDRAIKGENIAFSGYSGTGKTTVMKNIIINALAKKKKIIYISNSMESIEDVANFLKENGLYDYCLNMCKIKDDGYDSQVVHNVLVEEKFIDIKDTVDKETSIIKEFEKILNSYVANFKFVDLLKRYFLIDSFDEIKLFKLDSPDNYDYMYKQEYKNIDDALIKIENNLNKMNSFKDNVWNQIPHLNDIKDSDEVMNLITKLHEEFELLRNEENELYKYGIKEIESFSMLKKCVFTIEEKDRYEFPSKWKKDINQFFKAKDKAEDLKNDFIKYINICNHMKKTYTNLESISINNEIKKLYGLFYKENDKHIIDDIISNRLTIQNKNVNIILEIKRFKDIIDKFNTLMDYKISTTDEAIDDFRELIDMFIEYPICGKLMSIILNDVEDTSIQKLESILNHINELNNEIENLINQNPRKNTKLIKKGNEKHQVVIKYNNLKKKISKLEKEYKDITNTNYTNHAKVLRSLELLRAYNKKIKFKAHGKYFIDYILGFGIGNRKSNYDLLMEFNDSYKKVLENFKFLKCYGINYEDLSFDETLNILVDFNNYIIDLYKSNDLITDVLLDSNIICSVDTYYQIKNDQENYNSIIDYLRNNKEYQELYEDSYIGEKSNYDHIGKQTIRFNYYISLFIDYDKALDSLNHVDELKIIYGKIKELNNDVGANLKEYSQKKFKDSISRYYDSSLEENIKYLKNLMNNKEQLDYYLNVTSGLSVLNNYNLQGLINYIISNDNVKQLSEKFSYSYFKSIIDKVLEGKEAIIKSNNYLVELDELLEIEDELCNAISQNTITKLLKNVPKQQFNRKNNQPYITKANVTLSKMEYAKEYLKENQFDLVLIDDAHLINGGGFNDLFKNKQIVVCGDYQVNNVTNHNLISYVQNNKSNILRKRLVLGPRMLTYGLNATISPFKTKLNENRGFTVINSDILDYIYKLYITRKHIKINWFIKSIESQYQAYEDLALYLYTKNINNKDIMKILYENINIVDIGSGNYIHSDCDILNFDEYYNETSEVMANNYLEILRLSKDGMIIYDKEKYLDQNNIDYTFYNMIKSLKEKENMFLSSYNDPVSNIIAEKLRERGYKVLFPSNGINLTVVKRNSEQLVSLIILYSNGFVYDVKNNYRFLKEIYQDEGHKIIFRTMLDLISGPNDFVDNLCEEIDN